MTDPREAAKVAHLEARAPALGAALQAMHAADPVGHPFMAVPPEMATFTPILGNYSRFSVAYLARNHAQDHGRTTWVVLRVAPDGRNLGRVDC